MAYSSTKYQLTHLLQDAWHRMGQLRLWVVTGGSTTTVINTDWALPEEPIYEDDDPALILGTAVVTRDTGGLAPEGEFGMITDYDSGTSTLTIDALTTAVASGDRVGIASPLFPVEDMVALANIALRRLGDIEIPDTSLTVAAGQTEYTLPATIRTRPLRVRIQRQQASGDNEWELVQGWDVIPATAGSSWTLVVPQMTQGYSLEVLHRAPHPELTAYDSPIQETISPEVALAALVAEAYQWYNNQVGGSNQYFLQRENKAIQDLEAARVMHPITHFVEQVQGLPHWGRRSEFVPLTSDLRG